MKFNRLSVLVLTLCLAFSVGCGKKESEGTKTNDNIIESSTEINTSETENNSEETSIANLESTTVAETTTETTTIKVLSSNGKVSKVGATTSNVNSKPSASQSNQSNQSKPATIQQNRIIATSGAVADIMDRLGIDLVGVPQSTGAAINSRYNNVQRVGSPMEPDMEIIKSLKPTDVIGPDTLKDDLKIKYDNIGVKSTFVNLRSVQGLYDSVKLIGDKYGKSAEANALIKEYNEFITSYRANHKNKAKPKVLVLMGLPGSYLVATQNSYAGSLVELAGAENVFHHSSKDFINVNTEEILAKNPDIIIRTAHGLPFEALEMFKKEFTTNDIWKHFKAVKEGKVYDVDYTLFGMSATFDYPQALADLETILYGE